jgi:hypothetical protein
MGVTGGNHAEIGVTVLIEFLIRIIAGRAVLGVPTAAATANPDLFDIFGINLRFYPINLTIHIIFAFACAQLFLLDHIFRVLILVFHIENFLIQSLKLLLLHFNGLHPFNSITLHYFELIFP